MTETRIVTQKPPPTPRLIALMPAHNEAAGIAAALESVERQPALGPQSAQTLRETDVNVRGLIH